MKSQFTTLTFASRKSPASADPTEIQDRLLRAAEVQHELGVSRATAYRMMSDGTLPVYRFGGKGGRRSMVRVSLKQLIEWRESHRTNPQTAA
ncbi:MAG: helix-turn-helix domain-containing protein [Bryobacteraceae bacterium]